MYLAPLADDPGEAPASPLGMRDALATIAGGLNARFVAAGSALARAGEIVETLIAALEDVASAFERDATDAAVRNIGRTADRLARLPAIQADRREALGAIERASATLAAQIDQVNRTLSFLRICGLNIKVAAAGAGDFSGFADMMFAKIDLGENEIAGISKEISCLAEAVPGIFEVEDRLAAECRLMGPQGPQKLAEDARTLHGYQRDLANRATRIVDGAHGIRRQIEAALGALQIGSITRQRLEHVVDGLGDLAAFQEDASGLPLDVAQAMGEQAKALLSAQLADALEAFQTESRSFASSIRSIGRSAASLLELRKGDAADEGDDGDEGMILHMLERSASQVTRVTERLREADSRSVTLGAVASTTAEHLSHRLATVQRITRDVQQMAWNTDLRCYRMGTDGRGLAVIASEIRGFAATLTAIASGIAQSFQGLTAAAAKMRGPREEEADDGGAALAESLDCIRAGVMRLHSGLAKFDRDAPALEEFLEDATARLECEADMEGPLAAIAECLSGPGRKLPDLAADGAAMPDILLDRISARYTTPREREVHRTFLSQGSVDLQPPADTVSGGEDDFEDGPF